MTTVLVNRNNLPSVLLIVVITLLLNLTSLRRCKVSSKMPLRCTSITTTGFGRAFILGYNMPFILASVARRLRFLEQQTLHLVHPKMRRHASAVDENNCRRVRSCRSEQQVQQMMSEKKFNIYHCFYDHRIIRAQR